MSDILSWPAELEPAEVEFWPYFNTQRYESPFTRSGQTLEYPGCVWRAQYVFRNLTRDQLRAMEVLTLQLRGGAYRIRLGDFAFDEPAGPAEGSAYVQDDDQTGILLRVSGCKPEQLYLQTGDYFTLNDELKRLTADAVADLDGQAVFYFEPPLRKSPAAGTPITVRQAYAVMRLDNDEQLRSRRKSLFSDRTMDFTEALF